MAGHTSSGSTTNCMMERYPRMLTLARTSHCFRVAGQR